MRLLNKQVARDEAKKERERLLLDNARLREHYDAFRKKFEALQRNIPEAKRQELANYTKFLDDLKQKKEKSLKELSALDKAVEEKKEVYYGLVEKQDLLDEREHELNERQRNLDDRTALVEALEEKWRKRSI